MPTVVLQGDYIGIRCADAKGRYLQARKQGLQRLVFYSDHCGTWEQWKVVHVLFSSLEGHSSCILLLTYRLSHDLGSPTNDEFCLGEPLTEDCCMHQVLAWRQHGADGDSIIKLSSRRCCAVNHPLYTRDSPLVQRLLRRKSPVQRAASAPMLVCRLPGFTWSARIIPADLHACGRPCSGGDATGAVHAHLFGPDSCRTQSCVITCCLCVMMLSHVS